MKQVEHFVWFLKNIRFLQVSLVHIYVYYCICFLCATTGVALTYDSRKLGQIYPKAVSVPVPLLVFGLVRKSLEDVRSVLLVISLVFGLLFGVW